jgi:hypothetical protein
MDLGHEASLFNHSTHANQKSSPAKENLFQNDAGVNDPGTLSLPVDHERIDVNFLDLGMVAGKLGKTLDAFGHGIEISSRLATNTFQKLKSANIP